MKNSGVNLSTLSSYSKEFLLELLLEQYLLTNPSNLKYKLSHYERRYSTDLDIIKDMISAVKNSNEFKNNSLMSLVGGLTMPQMPEAEPDHDSLMFSVVGDVKVAELKIKSYNMVRSKVREDDLLPDEDKSKIFEFLDNLITSSELELRIIQEYLVLLKNKRV